MIKPAIVGLVRPPGGFVRQRPDISGKGPDKSSKFEPSAAEK
jgi:hypothetical protein